MHEKIVAEIEGLHLNDDTIDELREDLETIARDIVNKTLFALYKKGKREMCVGHGNLSAETVDLQIVSKIRESAFRLFNKICNSQSRKYVEDLFGDFAIADPNSNINKSNLPEVCANLLDEIGLIISKVNFYMKELATQITVTHRHVLPFNMSY